MIFISEGVKNLWLKRLKLKENEVDCEIIYNPIKEFNNTQKKSENIEQKIVIGCAGSFNENKNQKLLIEIYAELRKKILIFI